MATTIDLSERAVHVVSAPVPDVAVDRVLRVQGYTDLPNVRRNVRRATEQAVTRTVGALDPRVAFRTVDLSRVDADGIATSDGVRFDSPVFKRFFDTASQMVAFVVTAGERLDRETEDAIANDNLLEGVLMESAGWLALESVTRDFTRTLRDAASSAGMRLTRRMSPGYEYQLGERRVMWDLEEQASLFALFGNTELPVTLLESSAMLPKMSRSGLIGIRPARD